MYAATQVAAATVVARATLEALACSMSVVKNVPISCELLCVWVVCV